MAENVNDDVINDASLIVRDHREECEYLFLIFLWFDLLRFEFKILMVVSLVFGFVFDFHHYEFITTSAKAATTKL